MDLCFLTIVRRFCILLLVTLTAISQSYGDDCECSAYGIYDQIVPLAKEVGTIGMLGLTELQPSYYPTEEHRKWLTLMGWDQQNISWKCRKKIPITLRMRASTAGIGSGDQVNFLNLGRDYFDRVFNILTGIYVIAGFCPGTSGGPTGNWRTGGVNGGVEGTDRLSDPSAGSPAPSGTTLSFPEYCVSSDINVNAEEYLKMAANGEVSGPFSSAPWLPKPDYEVLLGYFRLIHSGSQAGAERILSGLKSKLTIDQKLMLVQLVGYRGALDYDDARRENSITASGIVSMDDLLKTWAANTDNGYNYDADAFAAYSGVPRPSDWSLAGVCRDVAVAQAKMLSWLGLKAYTISYATSGSMHTNVVAYEKNSPGKLHKINWSDRTDALNLEGGQALYQGHGDQTLTYRISDENGKMLNIVPSELGKTLQELAGFRTKTLDPLVSNQSNSFVGEIPSGINRNYRVFASQDGTGASYLGAALSQRYRQRGNAPGQAGVVVGTQGKDVPVGYGSVKRNLDFVYAQIEQHLNSSKKRMLNDQVQLQIESFASAMMLLGITRYGTDYRTSGPLSVSMDGDLRAQAGVTLKQGSAVKGDDQRIGTVFGAYIQVAPGVGDIRNMNAADLPSNARVVLTHALFSAEGRLRLAKSPEGRAYLLAATQVLASHTGLRGKAEVGVAIDNIGAMLTLQGRLTKDAPVFEEGTMRRIGAKVLYRSQKKIDADLSWNYNLDSISDTGTDFDIFGNIVIRH
jgi:hypothetical protein